MKVFILVECGFEHTTILDVFAQHQDAARSAEEHNDQLQAEWQSKWGDNKEMLASDPHDKACVLGYDVKGAEFLSTTRPWSPPLLPSPLTEEELEWVKEQQKIDAEQDDDDV